MKVAIVLNTETARFIADAIQEKLVRDHVHVPTPYERELIEATVEDISTLTVIEDLTTQQNKVHEDDSIILWEHPELGDHVDLMGYHKTSKRFILNTGFMDADDPQEINESLTAYANIDGDYDHMK